MNYKSTANTKNIRRLMQIAEVISGVFIKSSPTGDIIYLQAKDILMTSLENTASHIDYTPKLDYYMLKKGDILFAGKGSTYLCEVFDLDIPAVPSTTLYTIRLRSDIVSPQYLRWYLNHPKVVAKILTSRVGSGTPMIHKPTLENLEIIIPEKDVQQRIVELSELQKKEESLLKSIAEKRVIVTNQILMNEINK